MGNCQAGDAAAVVIQHPGDGKVERLYWPATAADVMRRNPGHYVALVVLHVSGGGGGDAKADPAVAAVAGGGGGGARITKVKLLKPKDTLLLGQVYRLITSQEVTKAVQARRQEKMRTCDEVIEQQAAATPEATATEAEGRRRHRSQRRTETAHRSSGTEAAGERPAPERHRRRRRRQRPALAAVVAEHH